MQATTHLTVYAVVWLHRAAGGEETLQQQIGSDCTLDGICYGFAASSHLRRATLPTWRMQVTTHLTVYAVVWLHRAAGREETFPTTGWLRLHIGRYTLYIGCVESPQDSNSSNLTRAGGNAPDGIRCSLATSHCWCKGDTPNNRLAAIAHWTVYAINWLHRVASGEQLFQPQACRRQRIRQYTL